LIFDYDRENRLIGFDALDLDFIRKNVQQFLTTSASAQRSSNLVLSRLSMGSLPFIEAFLHSQSDEKEKGLPQATLTLRMLILGSHLVPRKNLPLWLNVSERLSLAPLDIASVLPSLPHGLSGTPAGVGASSGPFDSISRQVSCNQILIMGAITGDVLQSSLILINQSFFSGSSDLQPWSENSTSDPSLCFHLIRKVTITSR
jgi:hypothetical protein